MADVTMNGVQIYFDTRTTAQWAQVSRVIPKGFICAELMTGGKCRIKIGDGVLTYAALPYVSGDIDLSDVDGEISTALTNYYTKTQTDSAIAAAISGLGTLFTLKGRVDNTAALPVSGNNTGDVYLVGAVTDTEFYEYYWTGTLWDYMGKTQQTDLSGYYTKTETDALLTGYYTKAQTDTALAGCVKTNDTLVLSCSVS